MKAGIPLILNLQLLTFLYTLFLKFSFISSSSGEVIDSQKLISDFRSSFFSGSKEDAYYLLDIGLEKDEKVVGYVDASNDKYLDLITVKKGDNLLQFYLNYYNYTSSKFYKNETKPFITIKGNYEVTNVFANVLFPGGEIAYVITTKNTNNELYTTIYYYSENQKEYLPKYTFEKTNVVIGDIDGDRIIDFLYFSEGVRKVICFGDSSFSTTNDTTFDSYLTKDTTICTPSSSVNAFLDKPFSDNGASAIVDITSDCRNDLIITSQDGENKVLEIYKGVIDSNNKPKLCLEKNNTYILNSNYGPFSLGDFNGDGYVDLIFPVIGTNKIVVAYNQYTPSFDWTDYYCRTHLISNNSEPFFNLTTIDESNYNSDMHLTSIEFSLSPDKKNNTLYKNPNFNTILRIGDFKSDGIPGILVVQWDGKDETTKTLRLYQNHFKEKKEGKHDKFWDLEHEFNLTTFNFLVSYASFFDFDESGQLSFLIMGEGNNQTLGFFNAYYPDTYFIKAKCMLEKNKYYTTEIGTNFRYIVTNNDGTRRMDVAFQMPQTTQMSLNLPYALVGIGRSNNYIENFNVISNSNEFQSNGDITSDNYTFTPIIPKSQMLITKGRSLVKGNYTVNWEIELIVNPTEWIWILIIVIAAILIVILIVIIILHLQEVKEDKQQESEKFTAWFA